VMTSRSPSERPWLSVVMPVHDGESWLGATLDSVAAQDCSGIEFIILDSSESDACEQIVHGFVARLLIRYEHVPEKRSWQVKTNLAVQRARASHVAMLHQDDLWLTNRTADARKAIAAYPNAVLLLNPSQIINAEGHSLGLWRCPLPTDRLLGTADIADHLLVQNFISIPAPVISKAAWLQCGGLDEKLWYTADWDLYFKLVRLGPAVYRATPSTAFRVHGSSMTVSGSRNLPDFERQMQIVVDRHFDLVSQANLAKTKRRASASIAVNCALAEAASGRASAVLRALATIVSLGPREAIRFAKDSRIIERALPRFKARLAGSL
jgi:glycosyltransferase involved in cell wall biosynthesis